MRRRLIKGAAGFAILAFTGAMVWFNFSASDSRANDTEGLDSVEIQITSICSENPDSLRRWKILNPGTSSVALHWDVYPNLNSGLTIADPGETIITTATVDGDNVLRVRWQVGNGEWDETMQSSDGSKCTTQGGCYATEVVSYNPGKRNDGSNLPANHRISSKALGAPEKNDQANYVSLGFGGEIVLKFESPIANGPGNDLRVVETTFGNNPCTRYPEKVMAFASQDGCNYIYLGEGCQDAEFDLGPMSWARYIKLKDISPKNHPFDNQTADGYDVDGIECLNGPATTLSDDGLVAGSAQHVVQYIEGTRKNGTPIHPSRTDPQMALGIPQDDDLGVNFVSMGFTGMLVLKFDYVVFNKEGFDLQVIETSFGIPECSAYPEQAFFEGSLDGVHWYPMQEICLDGMLELGEDVYAIQYIRITDRSPASEFISSADGYDLDGIMVLNHCAGQAGQARITPFDVQDVPDEISEITIGPNPFRESFNLNYETGTVNEKLNIKIYNYVGQQVHLETVNIPSNTRVSHNVNASSIPKGVYIVTLESGGRKQSFKVIKN